MAAGKKTLSINLGAGARVRAATMPERFQALVEELGTTDPARLLEAARSIARIGLAGGVSTAKVTSVLGALARRREGALAGTLALALLDEVEHGPQVLALVTASLRDPLPGEGFAAAGAFVGRSANESWISSLREISSASALDAAERHALPAIATLGGLLSAGDHASIRPLVALLGDARAFVIEPAALALARSRHPDAVAALARRHRPR